MLTLRPYQEECLNTIANSYSEGLKKQLIVIATGGGKTVIFSSLPKYIPNSFPMLILAHREELLDQAYRTISSLYPDLKIQVEQADRSADSDADIVIASVPTLGRSDSTRINKFTPDYFRTIVIDESHHSAAQTYQNILNYFNFDFLLGVTATPQRSDNVRLTDVFDEIVYYKTMQDLIEEGWLTSIKGYRVTTSVDLSSVKTVRGDYAEGELQKTIDIPARNDAIVESYLELTPDTKTIVFCAGVKHATNVADSFNKRSIPTATILGTTSSEDRQRIFQDFREGKIQVITNAMVLTEGFDEPSVETIILARPTQSILLYTQIVGRGVRLYDSKTHCNVIDIADASKGKKPLGLPSLLGLPPDFNLQGEDLIESSKKYKELLDKSPGEALRCLSLEDIDLAYKRIDLFMPPPPNEFVQKYSRFVWAETGENQFHLSINENENLKIYLDTLGRWTVQYKNSLQPDKSRILGHPKDMKDCFTRSDKWVISRYNVSLLDSSASWRADPVTPKQLRLLRRIGVPVTADMTKGIASQIISKYYENNPRPVWLKNKIDTNKNW